MKAITVIPGTIKVGIVERPEPSINSPDEVKLRVINVGICGTDREEISGGRAKAPQGLGDLIIGHEMLGQVVEIGSSVTRVKKNDFALFTVRRGCGACLPCLMNRPDMCRTGKYTERGIWGENGFQSEFVVDKEQYIVAVPQVISQIGVLTEPLSVAEKAIDELVRIQYARLPDAPSAPNWLFNRSCLVAGLGPIGLLAALALRLRGAHVYGLDIVDVNSVRPKWLKAIGGDYVDARKVPAEKVADTIGPMDIIVEASGVARLAFNLLEALAPNGACVLTGIPGGDRPIELPGAELVRQIVLKNQVLIGSVNAARDHYQMAVDDLASAHSKFGDHLNSLITKKYPFTNFRVAFSNHDADEIKVVIDWTKG